MHTESGQEELVVKELGLEKHLHFDWYRHASLVDHFFGDETSLEAVQQCKFLELGDFVNQPYDVRVETTGDACQIVLVRRGAIWKDGSPHQLSVEKRIMFRSGDTSYTVDYELRNLEQTPVDLWFGVEFNVGLMAGDAHDRYYDIEGRPLTDRRLRSAGEERDVQSFRFVDEWLGIHSSFRSDRPATLWRCPIETVSLSEAGLERLFQSSMVILHWKFQLEKSISFHLEQSVGLLRQEEKKLSAVRHRRSAEA
jgi:alpha-amylase